MGRAACSDHGLLLLADAGQRRLVGIRSLVAVVWFVHTEGDVLEVLLKQGDLALQVVVGLLRLTVLGVQAIEFLGTGLPESLTFRRELLKIAPRLRDRGVNVDHGTVTPPQVALPDDKEDETCKSEDE